MRVKRKTISVLLLSKREIDLLFEMIEEAKAGHTVHYSERRIGNNQFFGVSVDEMNDEMYRDDIKRNMGKAPLPSPKYTD